MAHFIGNILFSATYPFKEGAPSTVREIIRDVHLVGLVAATCTSISIGKDVFISFVGSDTNEGGVNLIAAGNEALLQVKDLDDRAWGWVSLAPERVKTPVTWSGSAALLDSVCLSTSIAPAYTHTKTISVEGDGNITVDYDKATDTVVFGHNKESFAAGQSMHLPEVAAASDAGITSIAGIPESAVTLQGLEFTVHIDSDLGHYVVVPNLNVSYNALKYVFYCYDIEATAQGHIYLYRDILAQDGPVEISLADSTTYEHPAVVTCRNTLIAKEWAGPLGVNIGDGDTPIIIEQTWSGCDKIDIFTRPIVCSVQDGSTVSYPLDALGCKDGELFCAPAWDDGGEGGTG